MEKVSQEIETKIQSGNVHGAFELLRGWYCRHGGKSPRPTHKDLILIRSQFRNLYHKADPSGDPLPIHVSPAPVNDSIPDEDEIWHSREAICDMVNLLALLGFVYLIYYFGMKSFLTFGMNLFLSYRMFLMAKQSHKNSLMRFYALF
jgi:hypothetical protein